MKRPETVTYLAKAHQSLREARIVADNDLLEAAGRAAYLAAFHAAQALVFDRTGKAAKTHRGVRAEFARLAKDDPRIDRAFPTFLARAYSLKETADYAIGHGASVNISEAEEAIEIASRLVELISRLLSEDPPQSLRAWQRRYWSPFNLTPPRAPGLLPCPRRAAARRGSSR